MAMESHQARKRNKEEGGMVDILSLVGKSGLSVEINFDQRIERSDQIQEGVSGKKGSMCKGPWAAGRKPDWKKEWWEMRLKRQLGESSCRAVLVLVRTGGLDSKCEEPVDGSALGAIGSNIYFVLSSSILSFV